MLKLVFVFCPLFILGQEVIKYEFNNKLDSIFYKNIANVFYVKNGKPISLNEDVVVTHVNRKTYAVEVDNNEFKEIELLIVEEKSNPETNEKETVIIDKVPIKLSDEEVNFDFCIGDNKDEVFDITDQNINICSNVDVGFKIFSYNLVINKNLIQVIGSKFNENVINTINECEKNQEIQFEVIYLDILKRKKTFIKSFIKK